MNDVTVVTYTLGTDGRWIADQESEFIIDINRVLSTDVSDEEILYELTHPEA